MLVGQPPMEIDVALVRELIGSQFPAWAHLPVEPVEPNGYDNRTFRLGSELSVRLPSHERYAGQVSKEQKWLPRLAPFLPLPIPAPVALGAPAARYPWHWSVYRWLPGKSAPVGRIGDRVQVAVALAGFLRALRRIDSGDGPAPGPHNFFRGGPLAVYDTETRNAIEALGGEVDTASCTAVWEAALQTTWQADPVWVHGDVASTNLLFRGGELAAVIDFGCCGIGDPACDLAIAWTLFSGTARDTFRSRMSLNDETWARARGWTLWKHLITLAGSGAESDERQRCQRVVSDVLADHEAEA